MKREECTFFNLTIPVYFLIGGALFYIFFNGWTWLLIVFESSVVIAQILWYYTDWLS